MSQYFVDYVKYLSTTIQSSSLFSSSSSSFSSLSDASSAASLGSYSKISSSQVGCFYLIHIKAVLSHWIV